MRRNAPQESKAEGINVKGKEHAGRFHAVLNTRNRKVKGMVERNGRYYAQMRVTLPDGKTKALRIPLEATRLDHAIVEAEGKRTEKHKGDIKLPGVRPTLAKLVEEYLESNIGTRRTRGMGYLSKSESTRDHEKQSLNRWIDHLGGKRIDRIEERDLVAFVNKRTREGVKNRTINLDLVAFNNCMGYAKKLTLITHPPRLEKQSEEECVVKRLLSREEINRFIEQAKVPASYKAGHKEKKYHAHNGKQLALFISLLASSGCREQEALKIKKEDVDMDGELLTIRGANTKSGNSRSIQLNAALSDALARSSPHCPLILMALSIAAEGREGSAGRYPEAVFQYASGDRRDSGGRLSPFPPLLREPVRHAGYGLYDHRRMARPPGRRDSSRQDIRPPKR